MANNYRDIKSIVQVARAFSREHAGGDEILRHLTEIEEALSVRVYIGGGPSLMYAADALAALEQWSLPEPASTTLAGQGP